MYRPVLNALGRRRELVIRLAAAIGMALLLREGDAAAQTSGGNPATTLKPRVTCMSPDPDNAGKNVAVFGYEKTTDGSFGVPYGSFNSVVLSNGGDISEFSGAPQTFDAGIHPNVFAVRYDPAVTSLRWTLGDGVLSMYVEPGPLSPVCEGVPGPAGPQGAAGATGSTGNTGSTGATGAQGSAGATGSQGATGAQGTTGATGARGLNWRGQWVTATAYAINDAVFDSGSSWAAIAISNSSQPTAVNLLWSVIASQGANGAAGAAGATGSTGSTGSTGNDGATGPQGAQGSAGAQGAQGLTGAAGSTGAQGTAGSTGAIGPIGPRGPTNQH